jgi:hypothetical protein
MRQAQQRHNRRAVRRVNAFAPQQERERAIDQPNRDDRCRCAQESE